LPYFGDAALDTVPVDYVAQVIKWSSDQGKSTVGKIFHLCSGPNFSIPLTQLKRIVRAMMKNRGVKLPLIIPAPSVLFLLFLKLITPLVHTKMRRFMRTLPIFVDYLRDRQLFENKNTIIYLKKKSGPEFTPVKNYLDKVFSVYLNTNSPK